MDAVTVYTDGSCLGNPGRGGWAYMVPGGPFASGFAAQSTNQRMEVTAALEALRALLPGAEGGLVVTSDSIYVVNCFRDRWYEGWYRRGWKNTARKPVANRDLWEPLLELALDPAVDVTWQWVKGHSGDPYNDEVDRLAVEAATTGVGTSGSRAGSGD